MKAFKAKFKAKTANEWDDRADFEPQGGKYDLVDVEEVRAAVLPRPWSMVCARVWICQFSVGLHTNRRRGVHHRLLHLLHRFAPLSCQAVIADVA